MINAAKNVAVVALGQVWQCGRFVHFCRREACMVAWLLNKQSSAAKFSCDWPCGTQQHRVPPPPIPWHLSYVSPACSCLQGKAEVVQRALEVQTLPGALPVQLVQPAGGKLTWVLDQGSAASLQVPDWALGSKVRKWLLVLGLQERACRAGCVALHAAGAML